MKNQPLIAAPVRLATVLIVLILAPIILITDFVVGFCNALFDWAYFELLPFLEDALYGPE